MQAFARLPMMRRDKQLLPQARRTLLLLFFLALALLTAPISSPAEVSVGISVTIGPPALPVYVQPPCPAPGFIWLPGYWAWDPAYGYYWVPGMWAPAPFVGALWTPGYWGWGNGAYIWHEGYWGLSVGFYGGINYGFGYTGHGYYGGYWSGNRYYYNRTVNNINVTNIRNVYSEPVRHMRPGGPSFNGGRGGTMVRPTPEQLDAARHQRSSLTQEQRHHIRTALDDPRQRASFNHGRPAIAATPRPGEFKGHGVVGAGPARRPPAVRYDNRAAPGERVRQGKPGPEFHRPPSGPGRQAPGTPPVQGGPGFNRPHQAPKGPHPASPRPQKQHGGGERREPR